MEEEPTPSTDSPLYIMSREEWGAADARVEDLDDSEFPVVIVNITHHVGAPACNSREECRRVMYDLQRQQIKEGAPDVHFNFIIGGDGTIFEGLGWKYRPWRFWFDDNRRKPSIDIGYLGDFRNEFINIPLREREGKEFLPPRVLENLANGCKSGHQPVMVDADRLPSCTGQCGRLPCSWFGIGVRQHLSQGYIYGRKNELFPTEQPVSQPIVMSLSSLVKEGQRQNLIHHTFDYVRHLTPVEPFHRNYP